MKRAAVALAAVLLTGCPEPPLDPIFPEDYATTFREVRNCRLSVEHDFNYIRVLANEAAADTYLSRTGTLPEDSVLVKEEHDNDTCTSLVGWAAIRRESGFAPTSGDWHWQHLDENRTVIDDGTISECIVCHLDCGGPPEGFDWTCTVPP